MHTGKRGKCVRALQFGIMKYQLYLLYYVDESTDLTNVRHLIFNYVHNRTKQQGFQNCQITFKDKNVRTVRHRSHGAYDVNLVMMDAYMDDEVDFFLMLNTKMQSATSQRNVLRYFAFTIWIVLQFLHVCLFYHL